MCLSERPCMSIFYLFSPHVQDIVPLSPLSPFSELRLRLVLYHRWWPQALSGVQPQNHGHSSCRGHFIDTALTLWRTVPECIFSSSVISNSLQPHGLKTVNVHGVFQARILEWVAISHSRRSLWLRDQICVSCISCISRWILYYYTTWEAPSSSTCLKINLKQGSQSLGHSLLTHEM